MYYETDAKHASVRVVLLHLAPVLVPLAVLFGGGLFVTFLQSIDILTPFPGRFSGFRAYSYLLTQSWFFESFGYSVYVAFASAILSLILGTGIAYSIWRSGTPGFSILYKIPLIMPHITVAFLTTLLLSDSGVVASISAHIFQTNDIMPPSILFRGNGVGLIAAYVFKESAFATVLVLGVLVRIDSRLILTAANLGATRWTTFRRVLMPQLFPVMSTTFVILFLYSFGAFDIPYLLSESRPQMLSIFVYTTYFKQELYYRPIAAAALILMFLLATVFLVSYSRFSKYLSGQVRKL